MNFEEFLLYLHRGAYEVATQLFMKELSAEHRTLLRLVSRTVNDIILDYPLTRLLFVSTHEADLRWLEAVSDNDRLLGHITTVHWYHSAHDFSHLYDEKFLNLITKVLAPQEPFCELMNGSFLDQEKIDNAKTGKIKLYLQWAKLANQQYINLKLGRDYTIMRKVVRKLKGVKRAIFSSIDQEVCGSPAWQQWEKLCQSDLDDMPLCFSRLWRMWFDKCGLCWREFGPSDHDMWRHLPSRGMKFFETLSCQETEPPKNIRLRWELPQLKDLNVVTFRTPLIRLPTTRPEIKILGGPIEGIEALDLTLKTNDEYCPSFSPAIKSLLLSGLSSLISVSIRRSYHQLDLTRTHELELLCDIILDLTKLKELRFEGPEAKYSHLMALGQRIRSHSQLRFLSLTIDVLLNDDDHGVLSPGHWKNFMFRWRDTQDLSRLEKLFVKGSVRYNSWLPHPKLQYVSNANTLEWLKGGPGEPLDVFQP